jgi:hypothetical protein
MLQVPPWDPPYRTPPACCSPAFRPRPAPCAPRPAPSELDRRPLCRPRLPTAVRQGHLQGRRRKRRLHVVPRRPHDPQRHGGGHLAAELHRPAARVRHHQRRHRHDRSDRVPRGQVPRHRGGDHQRRYGGLLFLRPGAGHPAQRDGVVGASLRDAAGLRIVQRHRQREDLRAGNLVSGRPLALFSSCMACLMLECS